MIFGIGIDQIEVERVATRVARNPHFRDFLFSNKEIMYCESKANKYEHYAARFAAKEAFFKALGTGWKNGISFNEIEVVNNELGKPGIFFLGKTAETFSGMGLGKVFVSLSHLKSTAAAVVIIETT